MTEVPRVASTDSDVVPIGLDVQIDESDDEIRVRIRGELDLATSPSLEKRIQRLGPWRATVVLDLTEVSFMDSMGLRVLWSIRQKVAQAGGKLVIGAASRSVARVLQTTKLDKIFELIEPKQAAD